jgi:hypothetical protein
VAQGGELPVANTNGFDYREVAFQFTETLTERDYNFPGLVNAETGQVAECPVSVPASQNRVRGLLPRIRPSGRYRTSARKGLSAGGICLFLPKGHNRVHVHCPSGRNEGSQ